jgi:plasmid stabilization system protein ParE
MRLEFHRQVAADISRILEYYEAIGEPQLADELYSELRMFFHKAAQSPEAYAVRERDIHRVNLERFPISFSVSHRQ